MPAPSPGSAESENFACLKRLIGFKPKFKVPEIAKHFSNAYQREVRIVFRPRRRPARPLEPMFVQIGSMEDYADLL